MCYIEQRFDSLAGQKKDGEKLRTKWKSDKNEYTSRTEITAFDFQHFSMHDKSHSVQILQNIELLLGRERVDMLGVGDLWLLLQAAYFHDIGMSLTREDMDDLWKEDSKFRTFLKDRLREGKYRDNAELFEAIDYYDKVDKVLNNKEDFDAVWNNDPSFPGSDWPIRLIHNVQYTIAEYVRKDHGYRSQNYFKRIIDGNESYAEGIIAERLYALVGTISSLHTQDFDAIFAELPFEEVAFGDEHIHPRFAAAMLRIGDLLDMDNNRFNFRILQHRGALPPKSMAHLRKHKALRHFEINETLICASARSDNFEACLETRRWYNWIDSEVGSLVKNWNRLVPKALRGCLLEKCNLKVYLNDDLFTTRDLKHFNFDSRKMQKLLIGDNIYDCRLDCLREYIQNAIDATKVCLWHKLKKNDINSPIITSVPLRTLLPCDLKADAFLSLPIQVVFSYEKSEAGLTDDKICIEIKDRGIGMDKACVDGITTIGKGWRTREDYQDVFAFGPKWLQPTGGFGIGVQSAFMLTDEVDYETRSEKESVGHRIRLTSPERSGNVTRENINSAMPHGTTVTFRVNAMKFMNYEALGVSEAFISRVKGVPEGGNRSPGQEGLLNMFNQTNILKHAISICKQYLQEQIPNAIFPIYIGEKGTMLDRISSPYLYKRTDSVETAGSPLEILNFVSIDRKDEKNGERYRYLYHIDINGESHWQGRASRIIIWNTRYMDCICLSFPSEHITAGSTSLPQGNIQSKLDIAFKNIAVPKEVRYLNCCSAFLDIMGERAEICLQVSRSKLKYDFEEHLNERLNDYLSFGLSELIPEYFKKKKDLHNANLERLKAGGADVSSYPQEPNTDWDLVRMIFCKLAYIPLSSTAEWKSPSEDSKHFGQEILDTVSKTLCIKEQKRTESLSKTFSLAPDPQFPECTSPETNQAETSTSEIDSENDLPSVHNMVEYCYKKYLSTSTLQSDYFFCADDLDYLEIPEAFGHSLEQKNGPIGSAQLHQALDAISKSPVSKERKEMLLKQMEQNTDIVFAYLLQSKEKIFNSVWGAAVFGCHTEVWRDYRKVNIEGRKLTNSTNDNESCFVAPLTVYYRYPQPQPEVAVGYKMFQEVSYNDIELHKKYPIAVSRVPFQPILQKGQWAIISPIYPALQEDLEKLKQARPDNVEGAVRQILNSTQNFRALVDWVYCFQLPIDNQRPYTKENITDIYLKWALDFYYDTDNN